MVWTLWGRMVLRWVAFPLAFLLLMLPINYPLEILIGFRLRLLATKLSALLLSLLGLKLEVHGTVITTSQFAVAIERPCRDNRIADLADMVEIIKNFHLVLST